MIPLHKNFWLTFLALVPFALSQAAETTMIQPDETKIAAVQSGEITEAKASWWGFNPEDSTSQLQAALDSGAEKLTIDKMESDWICRPLSVRSNMEIFLEKGVTIAAKRGDFKNGGDCLLTLDRAQNVSIHGNGGTLKMWKEDYLKPDLYKLAEWRHAVSLLQAKNVLIEDISLVQSGGDGIYVGASMEGPCEDITIRRVISDGNNRQGISIISVDGLLIEDSVFKNTGGTMPMAGLDVEPNSPDDKLKRVVIRNCFFDTNQTEGICFYLVQLDATTDPIDVLIENCLTRNNGTNGFAFTTKTGGEETQLQGKVLVRNCRFEGDGVGMMIQSKSVRGNLLEFDNVKLVNPSMGTASGKTTRPAPIQLYSGVRDTIQTGNIQMNRMEIVDPFDREELVYMDSSRMGVGITDLTGSITVRRTETGPVEKVIGLNNEEIAKRYPPLNPKQIPPVKTEIGDFIPYNAAHPDAFADTFPAPGIRARNQGDFRIYAKAGETVKFRIKEYPFGDCARDPVVPEWTDPDGNTTKLEPCEFLGEKSYEIPIEKTGVYKMYIVVNPHNFVFSDCNVPFAYWAEPYGMTIQSPGTFYFYVPEGTPAFGLKMDTSPAEPFAYHIFDPSGKEAVASDYFDSTMIWSPEGTPEPGIWTLIIENNEKTSLDDICFNFLGIPSFITTQKGAVFIKK